MIGKPLLLSAALCSFSLLSPAQAQWFSPPPSFGETTPSQAYGYSGAVRRPLPPNLYRDPRYADEDDYDVSPRQRSGTRMASLPPDADPNYSGPRNYDHRIDAESTRRIVSDPTNQAAGTITVNTRSRKLYLSLGNSRAVEYGIGVGRQGFDWKGSATIGRKAVWPGWTPPSEMLKRRPDLPKHMEGGMDNPLGARALYLFQGNTDTLFRIHGTNEPDTIGHAVSSGCIRMMNADVIDLYQRVTKGAKVVVI
jgi:lipoprotein-anchoring transpeptidase ErfK/SrfK